MDIEGSVVHYLLAREFDDVTCTRSVRRIMVDYPILFDEGDDMTGHTVLIPDHERPRADLRLSGALCVCASSASAHAARTAGFAVIEVRDDVTLPRLYNYMQATFVRFERLDAQLRAYVDTRAGAQALLDACTQATGCAFTLVDEQFRSICQSPLRTGTGDAAGSGQIGLDDGEAVDLFMAQRSYRHMRSSRTVFAVPGSPGLLAKNLFAGNELKGMLLSRHAGNALSARYVRFIVSYLGAFLERAFSRMGSFGVMPTGSGRIRTALARLLSGGAVNRSAIQSLLIENGHTAESRFAVLRIERSFTYEGPEAIDHLARRFELSWPRAYCFAVDGTLYMLADVGPANVPAGRDFMREVLIVARENLSKAGASRPFDTMDQLDAARVQADIALAQGTESDPTYWFYRFDDYALDWIVRHGRGDIPFEYVAHPAVALLSRHDATHGTELLRTLSTYLRCRYNATRASEELFIARSTLLNRLERISELTALDWDNPDDLVYLALSLHLA